MATLNQISYDLLSTIKGSGRFSDDNLISINQLEYIIINNRALLIRRDLTKGRNISDNIIQTLGCVEVIRIDNSLCPCTIPSDCNVLRTKLQLPKAIEIYDRDLYQKVSGVDIFSKGWSIISYARASVAGLSSFTANNTKCFLHNRYLYIINPPVGLSIISIDLVAEDPRDAANFANCNGTACYSNDSEFPISNYMIPLLKDMILKDLKIEVTAPIDYKGDEQNRSEQQSR